MCLGIKQQTPVGIAGKLRKTSLVTHYVYDLGKQLKLSELSSMST